MPKAYFIADLSALDTDDEVLRYRAQVPDTLAPFGGRFLVRGGAHAQIAGAPPPGAPEARRIVMLEFPSMAEARAWYESPAYQAILPLRLRHMRGSALLVEGIG